MIHLLLVDDQSLVRDGIKVMLNLEPDLQVVGTASNGEEAIEKVEALQPEVVLMDVRMPVMDGRIATQTICERFPNIKVLVLSTFDDDQYIAESMQMGAKGYLLKDMPSEELAEAIRFVQRGYTQFGPGLFEKMVAATLNTGAHRPEPVAALPELTAREREVLCIVGTGATNREIAQQLYIAEGTVKTYITSLFNRLNLKNRSQLAIYANLAFGDRSLGKSGLT